MTQDLTDRWRAATVPAAHTATAHTATAHTIHRQYAPPWQAETVTDLPVVLDDEPHTGQFRALTADEAAQALRHDARIRAGSGHSGRLSRPLWPLLAILVVQAALSLRLVWSDTAFQDEALYLWAGHLEWLHWLRGAPINAAALPTYFSGAPVVYPPLGALADSVGGLAAARMLSLFFMLGTTGLLYGTTRRLFDFRAALFAAALFAGVGSTQFLGAFATYDAMALFLLALSTWLCVRASGAAGWRMAPLLVMAGALMALADAAKYASALFDPVVIAVAVLVMWRDRGRRAGIVTGGIVAGTAALLLAVALRLGGAAYWHGIALTTTARQAGSTPSPGVLFISGKWIGAVAVLAVTGAVASRGAWPSRLLGWLLAAAVFLAPAEQARIHTLTSLFKHVGYGAWFGCVVAGFALDAFTRAVPAVKRTSAARIAMIAVVAASVSGVAFAASHFAAWPDESAYVTGLRPVLASAHGQVLVDDAQLPEYYLGIYTGFEQITNSSYFSYTDPVTHRRITDAASAYADAIRHRFFAVISLTYGKAPTIYDPGIVADIKSYGGYRLVSSVPYRTPTDRGLFLTWVREGAAK